MCSDVLHFGCGDLAACIRMYCNFNALCALVGCVAFGGMWSASYMYSDVLHLVMYSDVLHFGWVG